MPSKHPLYGRWSQMIQRCTNRRKADYQRYGGRGIRVCERWRRSFKAFVADIGERPSPAHTIDRINNDGDYEPGNVRWATASEQMHNRRAGTNTFELGGSRGSLNARAKLSEKDAITIRTLRLQGVPLKILAQQFNVSEATVCGIGRGKLWRHVA